MGVPYTTMVLKGTPLGFSSSTPAAFCLLLFVLLLVHVLLALLKRSWGLKWGELVTITIMMMVSAAIPTRGVTGMLLPMITGTFYYATPENDWAEKLHPVLPDWMLMSDPVAVRGFYEGSDGPVAIPWDSWLPPLLYWLLFYGAFYLTLISIGVILRRQWVEHERLAFPIAQVPLAMIEDDGGTSVIKPFFRSGFMWLGFAIAFIVGSLNALHFYQPMVTPLALNTVVELFRGFTLNVRINFLILGFSYLISSTLSLSLWFFYLICALQMHILGLVGWSGQEAELGPWSTAVSGHQMMGALTVMVFSGLWVGRHHLQDVWHKAVHRTSDVDDSDEIMSYRSAVLGFVAGTTVMCIWLWQSGIPGWIAALLVLAALIIFLGLTRAVVEAGIPTISPAIVPSGFVVSAVGLPALGMVGMVATAYTLIWCGELLVFMMAPLANCLRLTSETVGNRRRLFWAIAGAMLITLTVSIWYTLHLAYSHGGLNLHQQFFGASFPTYPSTFAQSKIDNPSPASLVGWLWIMIGGLVMFVLTVARHRLAWWPFHPLGYALGTGWTMAHIWFSVFLAWAFKALILKYGGPAIYRKTRPFFLGLVAGQFATAAVWLVIDSFTGTLGNVVPVLY